MPRNREIFLAAVLLLMAAPAGTVAYADGLVELLDARTLAQHAFYTRDANRLSSARGELERLSERSELAPLAHYYAGYAEYRLGQLAMRDDKGVAADRLDSCIGRAKRSRKLDKSFAEAYALMSACYGLKAAIQPWKAVYYGPQAGRMMKKARALDETNPRVILIDAIGDYHRPRTLGGNKERAEEGFNKAVEMFENQLGVEPGFPDWGHAEAYAYLGEIYLSRSEAIAARNALEQALIIAPDYKWAREMLRRVSAANGTIE